MIKRVRYNKQKQCLTPKISILSKSTIKNIIITPPIARVQELKFLRIDQGKVTFRRAEKFA